jgi:hypothetical protein
MLSVETLGLCKQRTRLPRVELARGALVDCKFCCWFYLPNSSGARAAPRNAWPARVERIVTNLSRYPFVAGCVAPMRSVTYTSLFGSAPWSPFWLIIDVIAQVVAVPSWLTTPAMLPHPPVARSMDAGRSGPFWMTYSRTQTPFAILSSLRKAFNEFFAHRLARLGRRKEDLCRILREPAAGEGLWAPVR